MSLCVLANEGAARNMRQMALRALEPEVFILLHRLSLRFLLCGFFLRNMADKYSNWTLAHIKKELKKRGSRVSGRKKDLVER